VKKHSILFLPAFMLLLFLFGCGTPPRDIDGGQRSQNQEALPSLDTPVAVSGDSFSSEQELTFPQGESSLPEAGTSENVFAVYGDGKLLTAWSTDEEGNNYPISKDRAEKLIPSDFVEKMKLCKASSLNMFDRVLKGGEKIPMDYANGVAYKTDFQIAYAFLNNPPNPCLTPLVLKIGWVSPDSSENTITKYAPEIPPCAAGGKLTYTSAGSSSSPVKSFKIVNEVGEGGFSYAPTYEGSGWLSNLVCISSRGPAVLKPGKWRIPTYAGDTSFCPVLWIRQLAVENLSARAVSPGGYTISGDIAGLPDHSWLPAETKWTLKITDSQQNAVFTKEGTGNKFNITWDGKVSGQAINPALYSFNVHVDAPQEKTWADIKGEFQGNPAIEIWTTEINPKLIATSDSKADQKTLLNQVFLPARQKNQVKVVVKDPPTSESVYQVKINTGKTRQDDLVLSLSKVPGTNRFEKVLYLGPNQNPGLQLAVTNNPQNSRTTFTSLDACDPFDDSNAFWGWMSSSDVIPPYPSARLAIGRALSGADPVATDKIEPSLSAVQAAGYEEATVFLKDRPDIKVRFRVKNEANVFYINSHGDHEYNTLYLSSFNPEDSRNPCAGPDSRYSSRSPNIEPADWGNNLRTIILYACSVLDINDFNNNCYQPSDRQRFSPGKNWDSLGSKNKVLLGYNYWAPAAFSVHIPIINKYFQLVKGGISEPMAWLRANADIANIYADNACAIDGNAYYFIKYEKLDSTGQPTLDPDARRHKNRTLRKISRTPQIYWNTPWQYLPQGVAVILGKYPDVNP
jgi:hypothetical protein